MKVKFTTLNKDIEKLIFSKFKIKKQSWNDNFIYLPYLYDTKIKETKIEEIDYDKFIEIREYIDILEETLTPKEKINFYNKLKTLKFIKNKMIFFEGALGIYYPLKNKIVYSLKSAMGHELLHMASNYSCEKFCLSGFKIGINGQIIGSGLNEGYTELLATRFFKQKEKPDAYSLLVNLTKQLEQFFSNKDEMRCLYFEHDLAGFISHMEQFADWKEILSFIKDMDKMVAIRAYVPFGEYIIYNKLTKQLNEWKKRKQEKLKCLK